MTAPSRERSCAGERTLTQKIADYLRYFSGNTGDHMLLLSQAQASLLDLERELSACKKELAVVNALYDKEVLAHGKTEAEAARYRFLRELPRVKAQAYFWEYESRKQRDKAIDEDIAAMQKEKP